MQNEYKDKKPYTPRVGDRVGLEGIITYVEEKTQRVIVDFHEEGDRPFSLGLDKGEQKFLYLISRAPRKLTKEEAEELLAKHLNESVTIV